MCIRLQRRWVVARHQRRAQPLLNRLQAKTCFERATTASMQLERRERFADYPFCARLADEEGAARK
jgi:hypothetical protein